MSALEAAVVQLPPRRGPVRAVVAALRPRQWTKNLLLYAGLVFAAQLDDPTRWLQATTAFVAWCAASSAAYLVNDVRDAPADRRHPVKRMRPIARGEVSPRTALRLSAALGLVALGLAAALGAGTLALLAAFLVLQAAYTTVLKRIVLVDVVAISALFVLRAAASAVAIDVPASAWLLVCTGLLSLFVALGKRRSELVLVAGGARGASEPAVTRQALGGYDLALLDQLLTVVAAATISAYALYTLVAHETRALVVTVPLVVLGVFRYLYLLRRTTRGEEPENVLLRDPAILCLVAGWVVTCALILMLEA